jgi:hypothetical protein
MTRQRHPERKPSQRLDARRGRGRSVSPDTTRVSALSLSNFGFVSGFGIRISDFILPFLCLLLLFACPASADSFNWNTNRNRVSADITTGDVFTVLERVAAATGWQIFLEPGTRDRVSAKFDNVPPGEALRLLLRDVNFVLLPETNANAKLYVYRSSRQNATQLVRPREEPPAPKPIPNELIVRLKPGAKIDDLARQLGAKVVGRIENLNAYRLQFDDAAATSSGLDQLAGNSDVASVDNNYAVERPEGPQAVPYNGPGIQLQIKPPPDTGRIIIGLVDTEVQPLGNNLDSFILKQVSVTGDAPVSSATPTHGTAMAETILRSLQSITKGSTSVEILPVNVYPASGAADPSTTTFDVANGIVLAVNGGAKVINLSLGSPNDSSFLHSVIQDVAKLNIPVFAAAGNQPVTTPYYPAAYPEVKAVTAVDNGQLAPYANRGSFVSLGAPGTSLVAFGNLTYAVQGTSVSSAFTSGLAAGYLETRGGVSQMQTFLNNNLGIKITTSK